MTATLTAPLPLMGIATATRCSCGGAVAVNYGADYPGKRWEACCHDCYDGTEDAGERAHVRGFGDTIDDALWDWQARHDEAHGVEWLLADLFGDLSRQLGEERERQRGWFVRCAGTGNPPETCPVGGELIYGPEYSPLWPEDAEW